MTRRIALPIALTMVFSGAVAAAETFEHRFEWSNPSRPGSVVGFVANGGISVVGYDGDAVVLEVRPHRGPEPGAVEERADRGPWRLPQWGLDVAAHEDQNVVTFSCRSPEQPVELLLRVPRPTSIRVRSDGGGDLRVEGVHGPLDLTAAEGGISVSGAMGPLVADARNGGVVARFEASRFELPTSITARDGNIDVSFPPDLSALLKLRADHGRIYSDFALEPRPGPIERRAEGSSLYLDKYTLATVNEGGEQILLRTLSGDITIHRSSGEE